MLGLRNRLILVLYAILSFAPCPVSAFKIVPLIQPEPGDFSRNVVDVLRHENLEQMRAAGLETAKLPARPWSGWFFPLNEGGLANRYGDPRFPKGDNTKWEVIESYLSETLGRVAPVVLSPAEKYDLLMGDTSFRLTRYMMTTAKNHSVNGVIQAWKGYCTGWANASMMLPRPMHSVYVKAGDGRTTLEFRPSDIKALGALLWANGSFPTRMVGKLCPQEPIRRDPVNGRPYLRDCQDTNAATWHVAVVNQIGVARRSLLIDSDPGGQVWNQPAYGYSYTYFNPITGQPASLEEARVRREDFRNDPYAAYRAAETHSIVGVEMKLTFIFEKRPDMGSVDDPRTDEMRVPTYKYDLELDASGRIIGGEWWSRLHPDVLWVALPGISPRTFGDQKIENDASVWNPTRALPAHWAEASHSGVRFGQVLGRVVEQLFFWAQ